MEEVPYQRGIGSLMYAATSTRPDIAFPVAILSQFMRNPGSTHWEAVKDVIRYLKGTADLKLTLGGTTSGNLEATYFTYFFAFLYLFRKISEKRKK
jgi:hypothetical protein